MILERVPAVPHPVGRHSRVCKWISFTYSLCALSYKPLFFSFAPGWLSLHAGPSVIPLLQVTVLEMGFPSLPCLCIFYPSLDDPSIIFLCRSCSFSPQFFSCSTCRCIFSVFVGGVEFRVFLRHHFGPLFWFLVFIA